MTYVRVYEKLVRLWDPIGLPDEGPALDIWAKEKSKSRIEIENRALAGKFVVYEPIAIKWAYALYKHCEQNSKTLWDNWISYLIAQHNELGTYGTVFDFAARQFECSKILQMLIDFDHVENRNSFARRANERLTWSEFAWYHVLNDALSLDQFDILFGFTGGELICNTTDDTPETGNHDDARLPTMKTDVELVKSRWHPTFECGLATVNRLAGKYLLHRIYFGEAGIHGDASEIDNEYGWLGAQKVQVVPVEMRPEDGCLKWEDKCPDPREFMYVSVAFVMRQSDNAYEVYGLDKENEDAGKFWGRFGSVRLDGTTSGAIFGRDRQTGGFEAYKFWLKRVDDSLFDSVVDHINNLAELFMDNRKTLEEKRDAFLSDEIAMKRVSKLLDEHERDLVHYLFTPRGLDPDDLISSDKVRQISYSTVFRGVKSVY